jgi:hypothetical protein
MSQLLYQGKFGKNFLLDCFKSGVVDRIVKESAENRVGGLSEPYPEGHPLNYFMGDGKMLPLDPKVLVLQALGRNPDAAAAALTQHFSSPVEVLDRIGRPQQVVNPMQLLYDYGHYEDKGAAFGHTYTVAVDHLHGIAGDPKVADDVRLETRGTVNQLTLDAIDRTLNAPEKIEAMTNALAHDLAQYHANDLIQIAGENNMVDLADPNHSGWIDSRHENRMMLTVRQERDLMAQLAKVPDAEKVVLDSTAQRMHDIVLQGTGAPPTAETLTWAHNVGAYTGVVMNAHDLGLQDKFDSSSASHKTFFKFLRAGVGLVPSPVPGGAQAAGLLIDGIDDATAAKLMDTLNQQGDVNGSIINALHAQMAAGYYSNDLIHDAPDSIKLSPGHPTSPHSPPPRLLKNYLDLQGLDLGDYNGWMRESGTVGAMVNEPSQVAHDAMQDVQNELPLKH